MHIDNLLARTRKLVESFHRTSLASDYPLTKLISNPEYAEADCCSTADAHADCNAQTVMHELRGSLLRSDDAAVPRMQKLQKQCKCDIMGVTLAAAAKQIHPRLAQACGKVAYAP